MPKAAIYARYSTHQQRDTSIDDQLRRCAELAARHGYETSAQLTFSDAGITGADEAVDRRPGYQRLLRAWEERAFDAVVVDEVSRLARGGLELAHIHKRVERTQVRLLSRDGVDSSQPTWSLAFNIYGAVAQQARRDTAHRVVHGMLGQLQRGYMIADAPFGYRPVVDQGPDGRPLGTRWEVDEAQAELVRRMYRLRRDGASYMSIARWLNSQGVHPPRRARGNVGPGFWRQSSVHRLLRNRVYVGEFVWNGSTFSQAKARQAGRRLEPQVFARPHLRLVDDETFRIVTQTTQRAHRGGRRRLLAGLLSCGECGSTLTVKRGSDGGETAYCAPCATAVQAGARAVHPGYVSTGAVTATLRHALRQVFGEAARSEFRRRLRAKLAGDNTAEVERLAKSLAHARSACARLSELLADLPAHSPELERQFKRRFDEQLQLEAKLEAARRTTLSPEQREQLEQQLEVDPLSLFDRLLDDGCDVSRTQAVLARLFPRITLVGKPERFTTVFEIQAAPGVGYAEGAGGALADDERVTMRLEVSTTARRPVRWDVRATGHLSAA
jgi:DNA invertase Pin-like site-specific DNA recombinase